ncbi:ketosteroid isomerase-related protein [Oceanobacter sp. 3_MG-2023]|uniref:ketosteroid isomerase-related protein n=1 Tax=Oceanobacter sp. 3_MG-2023 TaxID=3062622 RepID=UPI002733884D|nr:ketosteroid isomerase-related protein [Oceanobacter sp. 3_MG-2023]MDP2504416.1 ketosteroid isomerase-related protein [Oceanobacter sp. 3_MG-2023]
MTRSHTEALIFNYYQAFNQRDMTTFLDLLTADVIHDINQSEREIGKEAFARFMERMNRHYQETLKDIVILSSPDGERAAAEFVVHGEYLLTDDGLPAANGQRYVLPAGAFFDVQNGKIARVSSYYNLDDWIRQVTEVAAD